MGAEDAGFFPRTGLWLQAFSTLWVAAVMLCREEPCSMFPEGRINSDTIAHNRIRDAYSKPIEECRDTLKAELETSQCTRLEML